MIELSKIEDPFQLRQTKLNREIDLVNKEIVRLKKKEAKINKEKKTLLELSKTTKKWTQTVKETQRKGILIGGVFGFLLSLTMMFLIVAFR